MAGVAEREAGPRPGAAPLPAGPAARQMAGIAAASVAVATWCAAAAAWLPLGGLGVALGIVGLLLAAGAGRAIARRSIRVLPAGKDVLVLTVLTAAGFFAVYLAGWADKEHVVDIARLLPLVVLGLSVLWPEPNVLRYSLLLGGGTLLGAPAPSGLAVGGCVVAMAVALVATNRLAAAAAPRLGQVPPVRGRRLGAEAGAVLVVVGLLAALAASLVPPPPGEGGGGSGGERSESLPEPAAPPVRADDRVEVGAGRGALGDGAVFLISARKPDVWRATTYDHWDGEAWSRSPEVRSRVGGDVIAPGIGDVESTVARAAQDVTVLARSTGVLVAAARPTYAFAPRSTVSRGADTTLYPSPPIGRGDRYTVFSDDAQARGDALRAIPDSAVPAGVAGAYLQLPEVSPRVRARAAEITAGRTTTYARVRAVEGWIDDHTSVTEEVEPVPPGADPIEAFLFDQRAGSPERAATAMSVMLRSMGIPARMAVGFLPGTRTEADRRFLVRAHDAHAWVEVWFPTAGWQRFDPTGLAPDAHASDSVWDRLLRFLGRLWPLLVLLVLAAGAWLAWRLAARRRRTGALPLAPRRRAALPWVTRYYARLERAGAARGRPRRPNETPREYTSALAGGALPDPRLEEVGALVTVAAWSRHEPAPEDRARAEEVLRAAMKAAPVPRRGPSRRRRVPAPAAGASADASAPGLQSPRRENHRRAP